MGDKQFLQLIFSTCGGETKTFFLKRASNASTIQFM